MDGVDGTSKGRSRAWLGHSPHEHLATYAQATLVDRDELDYPNLLDSATRKARLTGPGLGLVMHLKEAHRGGFSDAQLLARGTDGLSERVRLAA